MSVEAPYYEMFLNAPDLRTFTNAFLLDSQEFP
jgi:hypothetical protein